MITESNNKRIARNTMMLYFRMLLIMVISLYTVRVVLDVLGIVDYGIYNVVGGIVAMFSFLSNTMSIGAQRFFSYELGRKDYDQLKKTFSMIVIIYLLLILIILLLAETVGLWFLNNKMNIPIERLNATHWVYQFSILSFIMIMLKAPYDAVIIARENMRIYAYISIVDVIFKLAIIYLLLLFSFDKLKVYSVLIFIVSLLNLFIYLIYCTNKYEESKFSFYWDKKMFLTLISYSGWNLFGGMAVVLNNQGLNILLNMFFNPAVNAARGIAFQINSTIQQFSQNFMTAVRPQIIKYYARDERERMHELIFRSSKFSFYLMAMLSLPVLAETHSILAIWLKVVPEFTVIFTRLSIISVLIESISYSLMIGAHATGKMKKYQLIVSFVMFLNIPISYLFLKFNYQPQVVFYLSILNVLLCLFVRLSLLGPMIDFPIVKFTNKVIFPAFLSVALGYIFTGFIIVFFKESLFRLMISSFLGVSFLFVSVFLIGMSKVEKQWILQILQVKVLKKKVL